MTRQCVSVAWLLQSRYSFSQTLPSSAFLAASTSAACLLEPVPRPRALPSHRTSTTNVFACSGPVAEILKSLQHGTYQMRVDRDVHARATGNFADADSAKNLADMARGLIALAKVQAAKQQPDLVHVLDGIQISSSGSSVTSAARITGSTSSYP